MSKRKKILYLCISMMLIGAVMSIAGICCDCVEGVVAGLCIEYAWFLWGGFSLMKEAGV